MFRLRQVHVTFVQTQGGKGSGLNSQLSHWGAFRPELWLVSGASPRLWLADDECRKRLEHWSCRKVWRQTSLHHDLAGCLLLRVSPSSSVWAGLRVTLTKVGLREDGSRSSPVIWGQEREFLKSADFMHCAWCQISIFIEFTAHC